LKTIKNSFDLLIGLLFLSLLGLYLYTHFLAPKKLPKSRTINIVKANDILRSETRIAKDLINTTATSNACTMFLKNSAELSMNNYANEFIDHKIDGIIKTCSGAFPSLLQLRINNAILACNSSTRENITRDCYGHLIEAKTTSVATIIRPEVLPENLPITVMLHLVANMFATNELFEHPEKSLDLVDTLIDKEPGYLGAYKVKLYLLTTGPLSKDERYNEIFENTLNEAKILSNTDPDIIELELAKKEMLLGQSNQVKYIKFLDIESAKHTEKWIYNYYKTKALYNQGRGNIQQAISNIEGLLTKYPDNSRLKQTLDNLNSDDENKRKHPFVLTINYTLDDL
jgi:hypothetical protein